MDLQKIGACLRDLRKEKDLTQDQVAEQFHVSQRTVSRWETGSNMPDLDILLLLAEFYEVDLRALLYGDIVHTKMAQETKETVQQIATFDKRKVHRIRKRFIWIIVAIAIVMILLYTLTGVFIGNCIGDCIQERAHGPVRVGANYRLLTDTSDMYRWSTTDYLSTAENASSIIIIPTFQSAAYKNQSWTFNLILHIYSTEDCPEIKVTKAFLRTSKTAELAIADFDQFEYCSFNKSANELFYESIVTCKGFSEISETILKSEKNLTLMIEYYQDDKNIGQEYKVEVSSLELSLFDILCE